MLSKSSKSLSKIKFPTSFLAVRFRSASLWNGCGLDFLLGSCDICSTYAREHHVILRQDTSNAIYWARCKGDVRACGDYNHKDRPTNLSRTFEFSFTPSHVLSTGLSCLYNWKSAVLKCCLVLWRLYSPRLFFTILGFHQQVACWVQDPQISE